jgi:hypothetical protein
VTDGDDPSCPVDEGWMARCAEAPVPTADALTRAAAGAYGQRRPEGAWEPTNGHDRITAHVAWTVPSGLLLSANEQPAW